MGESQEIVTNATVDATHIHGHDGFNGVSGEFPYDPQLIRKESAVSWMVDTVMEHRNNISIITLGPLTNIAKGHKMNPNFANNIKHLYIMGGNYTGVGNCGKKRTSEFNFHADPEAAALVFDQMTCTKTLVPWETCLASALSLDWYNSLFATSKNVKMDFFKRISDGRVNFNKGRGIIHYLSCDTFAMAAFLYPDKVIMDKLENVKFTINTDIDGEYGKGGILTDQSNNVTIPIMLNKDALVQLIHDMLI